MIGVSHVAVQFPLYEQLKLLSPSNPLPFTANVPLYGYLSTQRTEESSPDASIDTNFIPLTTILAASTVSKAIASITTYPHEVIRTRLQNESTPPKKYFNIWSTLTTIVREEGARGLYKGIVTNLVRTVPASAVTLLSYETFLRMLTTYVNAEKNAMFSK